MYCVNLPKCGVNSHFLHDRGVNLPVAVSFTPGLYRSGCSASFWLSLLFSVLSPESDDAVLCLVSASAAQILQISREQFLFSAVSKSQNLLGYSLRSTFFCCLKNYTSKNHVLPPSFSEVLKDQNVKGPPDVRLLPALLFLLFQRVREPTNVLPLYLPLKHLNKTYFVL